MAGRGFRRPGPIVCGPRHNSLFQVDLKVEKGSSEIVTGYQTEQRLVIRFGERSAAVAGKKK
jgi:hypothetical protein